MADENGIVTEYTPGNYVSWDEANFPWESVQSNHPWDAMGRGGMWEITIPVGFSVESTSVGTHIEKTFKQSFSILDFHFSTPNTVMFDLQFSRVNMDENDFINESTNISPLGYEHSRPLIPGEYTYKEAYVGVQMKMLASEGRLGFYGMKLNVDIEDVVDKGIAEVDGISLANVTFVPYNKKYYRGAGEIICVVLSAEEPADAEVLDSDTEGFHVFLRARSDSTRWVQGRISWLANGY